MSDYSLRVEKEKIPRVFHVFDWGTSCVCAHPITDQCPYIDNDILHDGVLDIMSIQDLPYFILAVSNHSLFNLYQCKHYIHCEFIYTQFTKYLSLPTLTKLLYFLD
jgi:hypothetical protein